MSWRMAAAIMAAASCTFIAAARAAKPETPSQQLQVAIGQYEHNDYTGAIASLVPLLYPTTTLPAQDELLRAHRLLGISYYMTKDTARAEAEFQALLAIQPSYQLDMAVDPPEVVNFFEQVRRKDQEAITAAQERLKAQQEAKAKEEEEARQKSRERLVVTQTVEHVPFGFTLVPLGIGQFAENRRGAGWFFLSTEAALGVTSAALYVGLPLRYGIHPRPGDLSTVRDGEVVQIATGSLCLALAAAGIADAVYHYEPDVQISQTQRVIPAGVPISGPAARTISLVPFATPSGGGFVLGGVF